VHHVQALFVLDVHNVYVYRLGMENEPIDNRVALNLPLSELEALDRYCAKRRRATGEMITRSDVIRQAIREEVGYIPPDPPPKRKGRPT
jgi:hypothetical protein